MLAQVVPMGNSKGIRIPQRILANLHIERQVDIEVREGNLIISPLLKKPRDSWEKAFAAVHESADEVPLLPDVFAEENGGASAFDWEW
jgi:antitoxin MazE